MLALIQRVTRAEVRVSGETVGAIGAGLLALVAIEPGDGEAQAQRMGERLLGYRVFDDGDGRMNRSLADTGGGLLLVSQFTLAADTRKGMRPGFELSTAADFYKVELTATKANGDPRYVNSRRVPPEAQILAFQNQVLAVMRAQAIVG